MITPPFSCSLIIAITLSASAPVIILSFRSCWRTNAKSFIEILDGGANCFTCGLDLSILRLTGTIYGFVDVFDGFVGAADGLVASGASRLGFLVGLGISIEAARFEPLSGALDGFTPDFLIGGTDLDLIGGGGGVGGVLFGGGGGVGVVLIGGGGGWGINLIIGGTDLCLTGGGLVLMGLLLLGALGSAGCGGLIGGWDISLSTGGTDLFLFAGGLVLLGLLLWGTLICTALGCDGGGGGGGCVGSILILSFSGSSFLPLVVVAFFSLSLNTLLFFEIAAPPGGGGGRPDDDDADAINSSRDGLRDLGFRPRNTVSLLTNDWSCVSE